MSPSINHSVLQNVKTDAIINEKLKLKLANASDYEQYC